MKRKLSILLIGSVIAVSLAGCGGSQPAESSGSANENTSSVTSSDSEGTSNSENSQNGESNADTSSENSASESSDDEEIKYIDTNEISVAISAEVMSKSSAKLDEPAVYVITSVDELNKFYNDHKDEYSLDKSDSGDTFKTVSENMDNDYFADTAAVITVIKYDKTAKDEDGAEVGAELGMMYVENKVLTVEVYAEKPADDSSAGWKLIIASGNKNQLSGVKNQSKVISPSAAFVSEESGTDDSDDEEVIVIDPDLDGAELTEADDDEIIIIDDEESEET